MREITAEIALVAAGGALGALSRYGVAVGVAKLWPGGFPLATLLVNLIGCFAIGLVMHYGASEKPWSPAVTAGIAVGFLGALTTFSSFSYQTWQLWEQFAYGLALLNVAANLGLCLLTTWAGLALGKMFHVK